MENVAKHAPRNQGAINSTRVLGSFLSLVGAVSLYLLNRLIAFINMTVRFYWAHKLRFGMDVVMAIIVAAVLVAGYRAHDTNIRAQVNSYLVTTIDQHATFKRSFDRTEAVTSSREFMAVGGPDWLRQVGIEAILTAAHKARFSPELTAVWLALVDRESGFNPLAEANDTESAVNTACGLNQFTAATGAQFGLRDNKCLDPDANARAQVVHLQAIMRSDALHAALRGTSGEERLVTLYREVYCRHHDGLNAKNCSVTAEGTAMRGTPLLFKAYRALQNTKSETYSMEFHTVVYSTLEAWYHQLCSLVLLIGS